MSNLPWQCMETAPRDGTLVELCWMDGGKVQESFAPMRWSHTFSNPLVQDTPGIWVMIDPFGRPSITWSEVNPDGAPTHWRPYAFPETGGAAFQNIDHIGDAAEMVPAPTSREGE